MLHQALIPALLLAATLAQDQPPVFRSGVQVVEVDARVFTRDGRFVGDLSAADFELLEDGVPQQIQTVFLVRDVSGPAAGIAAPGDAPAGPTAAPASARQTWLFVFDLNHLTPGGGFNRAKAAVREFVQTRFRDGDLAGVVAGSRMVNNRLTSVREEVVQAIESVRPQTDARNRYIEMTREWPRLLDEWEVAMIAREDRESIQRAVIRACSDDADACRRADPDMQVRAKARRLHGETQRATMDTLKSVHALSSGLARLPGPKTVVFLSEGFVAMDAETTVRGVVGQTARAGARVYAIDVRGLSRVGNPGIIDQDQAEDPAGPAVRFDGLEDGPNSLSVDTGGLMIRNQNNIGRALDDIARDSGTYYVLAYQPADTAFDGKYRTVQVRVKRPDVRVRARRGYLAVDPARMLAPQPVSSPAPREESGLPADAVATEKAPLADAPAGFPGAHDGPEEAVAELVAPAAAAGPPTSAGFRLRPDAADRVLEIAGGDRSGGGDAASRGWDAYQRGDLEGALAPLEQAAAAPGVRPWVLYALGMAYVAADRPADAAMVWERVRAAAPHFAPVYMDLAAAYLRSDEITPALAVLRDGERRWPSDPEFHNAIGVIHVRRGALDAAIASFTRASEAAPDDPVAWLNLGRTYELRYDRGRRYVPSQRRWVAPDGDRKKAAECYERYIALGGPYASQAAEALSRMAWVKP